MKHYSLQSVGVNLDIPSLRRMPVRRHSRDIIAGVAAAFKISVDDIMGESRFRRIAWARQAAYLLIRRERKLSYPQIGQIFGRDHATVVHGCHAAEARLESDPDFAAAYWRAAR